MEADNSPFDCDINEPNYLFEDGSFPFQFSTENSNPISLEPAYLSESSQPLNPQNTHNEHNNNYVHMEQNAYQESPNSQFYSQEQYQEQYPSQNNHNGFINNQEEIQSSLMMAQGSVDDEDKKTSQEQSQNSSTNMNKTKSQPKISPRQTSSQGAGLKMKEKALSRKMAVMKRQNIEAAAAAFDENSDEVVSDKKQQQKIKNRISAQRSRDSKKHELVDLKEQINHLSRRVDSLTTENKLLKNELEQNLCVKCKHSMQSSNNENETTNSTVSSPVSHHEFGRSSNSYFNGNIFSSTNSIFVILAVVLCLGVALHGNQLDGMAELSQQTNVLRLHEIGHSDVAKGKENIFGELNNQLVPLSTDQKKDINYCGSMNNLTNQETLNKLLAVNGMNSAELNYGTQIIDSRVQSQLAPKKDLAITEQDINNLEAQNCFSQETIQGSSNSISQKRDQIFCTDATIILGELDSKLATKSPLIDLVYSTKHAKQFVQFGDQHFQTKPDERDRYVHLTCQVIDFYSSELPSSN